LPYLKDEVEKILEWRKWEWKKIILPHWII
jgi:hypothetical protein